MEFREPLKFILPSYRIQVLGFTIILLFLFGIYSILAIDREIESSDFLVLLFGVLVGFIFWRYLKRYGNVGFVIKDGSIFLPDGRLLCKLSSIETVDTSPYTFKSTNGFIIRLKERSSLDWSPGLFWKLNKRISIGGLITKSESKWLSTAIITILAREG